MPFSWAQNFMRSSRLSRSKPSTPHSKCSDGSIEDRKEELHADDEGGHSDSVLDQRIKIRRKVKRINTWGARFRSGSDKAALRFKLSRLRENREIEVNAFQEEIRSLRDEVDRLSGKSTAVGRSRWRRRSAPPTASPEAALSEAEYPLSHSASPAAPPMRKPNHSEGNVIEQSLAVQVPASDNIDLVAPPPLARAAPPLAAAAPPLASTTPLISAAAPPLASAAPPLAAPPLAAAAPPLAAPPIAAAAPPISSAAPPISAAASLPCRSGSPPLAAPPLAGAAPPPAGAPPPPSFRASRPPPLTGAAPPPPLAGAAPPPPLAGAARPPPLLGALGGFSPIPDYKPPRPRITPRVKMRPFHWNPIAVNSLKNKIWDNTVTDESVRIDISSFEKIFGEKPQNSRPKTQKSKKSSEEKEVKIIDSKRAYSIDIVLSRIRMSHHEIRQAILDMDSRALNLERIQNLVKIVPTDDESRLIRSYKGDPSRLSGTDQFFYVLREVKDIKRRLEGWLFKLQFTDFLNEI
eukprot:950112_1